MNHSKRSPQPSKLLTLRILGLFVVSVVLSLSVFFVLRREASKVEAVVGSLKIGGGTSVTTMSNETFYSQTLRWGYNGTNTTDTYSIMYTNGTLGVGIGTTQPGAWVHIKDRSDSIPNLRLTSNTNGSGYDISVNGTSNYFSIKDNTSGNQRVTILPNGNVGINVQTPGAPLDITGNTRTTGQFQSTVTTGTAPLTVASTTVVTNLNADLLDGQHGAYYLPLANVAGTVNQVPKFTGANTLRDSTITDNGNVGIGSTVPGNKLDVGSATTHIVRSYGGYTGNAAANIGGTGAAAYFPSGLYANGTNNWLYGTTTHNGTVQDNASRWSINPAGTVYFNTGGSVGVGTTTPGAKLDVNGNVKALGSSVFAQNDNVTTAYTAAPIQLREAQFGASASYLPPRISFHWGGVVASQIGVQSSGRIAIMDNPGTGYQNLIATSTYLGDDNTRLLKGGGNALRVQSNSGYVDVGAQNASWAHMQTDLPRFYFNKGLTVDTGLVGSYSQDLNLQTAGTTRMTISTSNGNVGIGSTAPAHKLQVAGAIHADITGGNANLNSTTYEVAGTNMGAQTYYAYGAMCVGNSSGECATANSGTLFNNSANYVTGATTFAGIAHSAAGVGFHTNTNDSWFPYTNGYNYFRGPTYAFNNTWYDENNTGYFMDLNNTTRLAAFRPNYVDFTGTYYNSTNGYSYGLGINNAIYAYSATQMELHAGGWYFRGTDGVSRLSMTSGNGSGPAYIFTDMIGVGGSMSTGWGSPLIQNGGASYLQGDVTIGYYEFWAGYNLGQLAILGPSAYGIYTQNTCCTTPDSWFRIVRNDARNTYHDLAVGRLYANGAIRFDLAEITPVDPNEDLSIGELVSANPGNIVQLHRSTEEYDPKIIGIVSDVNTASMTIGGDTGPEQADVTPGKKPIALSGRVTTIVNLENGPIRTGDRIAASKTHGVGMKATRAGQTVSKALERFDGTKTNSTGVEEIIARIRKEIAAEKPGSVLGESLKRTLARLTAPLPPGTGRIITFVSVGDYDPTLALNDAGEIKVTVVNGKHVVQQSGSLITRIGAYAELVAAKIRAGVLEVQKLIVNGVDVMQKLTETEQKLNDTQKTVLEQGKKIEELEKALKSLQTK